MSTKTVEHFDWRTCIEAKPDTPQNVIDALDAYFKPFAALPGAVGEDGRFKVAEDHPCFVCDEPLTGFIAMTIGRGGFEWGLIHGEGLCRNCRWPARAYHYIKDADGNDLMTLRNVVLQYHPDVVSCSPDQAREKVRERGEAA